MMVLEAENLGFAYNGERLFENVGFSIAQGDFAAIIGSNGTGKSTLLRVILGELSPAEGSVRLFAQEARRFRDWPKIGYVPQTGRQAASFPATALEIVLANLYAQIGLMRLPAKRHKEQALHALALVGMEGYANRMIGELSGGQQQRVQLARVLVSGPRLMLLDEPTTGIDAQTIQSLYELLARLNRETGLTIVMVTHDIARAAAYVNRIFCLEEGSLVELERMQVEEELSHRHKHPAACCAGKA